MIHNNRPDGSTNPIGVSNEKLFESSDRVVNSLDDLGKIGVDRIGSIWSKDSPFKRYAEDGMCIHFHVGLWSSNGKSNFGDYCAIVQSGIKMPYTLTAHATGFRHLDAASVTYRLGHCEELMFVSGIQLLKEPEMILLRMRSHIRLAISDFDKCALVDSLIELPPFNDVPIKSGFSVVYGEKGVSVGQPTTGQSPSNVIKRRARVMDTIPNDERPLRLRDRFSNLELEQISSLFTIIFLDEGVGLRIEKSADFCVKRSVMYFSSLDFMPTFD